jgi:hypothetical protein
LAEEAAGTLLVGGNAFRIGDSVCGLIRRLSPDGNVVAERSIASGTIGPTSHALALPDGRVAAVGSFGQGPLTTRDGAFLLLEPDLAVTSHVAIGGALEDSFSRVARSSDGTFLAIGATRSFSSSSDAWAVKLDSLGSVQWQRVFAGARFHDVVGLANGNFLCAGLSALDIVLLEFMPDGTIVRQAVLTSGLTTGTPKLCARPSGGAFLSASLTFATGAAPAIVALAPDLGIEWQETIRTSLSSPLIGAMPDGGLVLACSYRASPTSVALPWVGRIDPGGSITWQLALDIGNGEDTTTTAVSGGAGHVVLAGLADTPAAGAGETWVARLDDAGGLDAGCHAPLATSVTPDRTPVLVASPGTLVGTPTTAVATNITPSFASAVSYEGAPGGDAFENDDGCTHARLLRPGEGQARNFCDDAEDWLVVHQRPGDSYVLETSNLGSEADTVIDVFDGSCAGLITSDDDGAGAGASRATWIAADERDAIARIRQKDGTSGDLRTYDILLSGRMPSMNTWSRVSDVRADDRAWDTAATDELSLQVTTTGILGLDAEGSLLWRRVGGSPYVFLTHLPAGGLVSLTSSSTGCLVTWMDPAGAAVAARAYDCGSSVATTGLAAAADGSLVFGGEVQGDLAVIRTDASGNITWQHRHDGLSGSGPAWMTLTPDGSAAVHAQGGSGNWMLGFAPDGVIRFSKRIDPAAPQQFATGIAALADGGAVAVANLGTWSDDSVTSSVVKLAADGTLDWAHVVTAGTHAALMAAATAPDGGALVAGRADALGPTFTDGIVAEFMADGTLAWTTCVDGGSDEDIFQGVEARPDGRVLAGGYTSAAHMETGWDCWLVNLPASGAIDPGCRMTRACTLRLLPWTGTITDEPVVNSVNPAFVATDVSPFVPTTGPITLRDHCAVAVREDCANGADDDGDLLIDCDDADCLRDPRCHEVDCTDGADGDGDTLTDCADADCGADPACLEGNCADGIDNDGDGDADCADSDCAGRPPCVPEDCTNGIDDDGDTLTDCADVDCIGAPPCVPEVCFNGVDDDGDTFIDCADPDCVALPGCIDRDGDTVADGLDCAPLDPSAFAVPPEVANLSVEKPAPDSTDAVVTWTSVLAASGTGTVHDVVKGGIRQLWADRDFRSATCLSMDTPTATTTDTALTGGSSDGFWYLVEGENVCGAGGYGTSSSGVGRSIPAGLCD